MKLPEKGIADQYPPQKSFRMITNSQGPITLILRNIGRGIQSTIRQGLQKPVLFLIW